MRNKNRLFILALVAFLLTHAQPGKCMLPNRTYSRLPSDLKMTYDSLNIKTTDGLRLTAWLCKSSGMASNAFVILASGDAGNMSDNLDLAQAIVSNFGVSVLLFDYRGFGTSDYVKLDTDLLALPEFAIDLNSVVKYLHDNIHPDTDKVFIYGRSLGASLALTVASSFSGIGGVIAESPYVSQALLYEKILIKYKEEGIKRSVKKIDSKMLEPLSVIGQCRCKVFFIHGQDEDLILSDEIFQLYNKCGSKNKSIWIASGANHLEVPFKETNTFLNAFLSFVSGSK